MKTKKKLLIAAILISSVCSFGATLDSQVDNLEVKLNRAKKINQLTQQTKKQQHTISKLTQELKEKKHTISKLSETVKTDQIEIGSIKSDKKTFRNAKSSFEKTALKIQKELTASYNDKVNQIQRDNTEKYNQLLEETKTEKNSLQTNLINLRKELVSSYEKEIENINSDNTNNYRKLLNRYSKEKQALEHKINDQTVNIEELSKQLKNAKDKSDINASSSTALFKTVNTLSKHKEQLEQELSKTESKTIKEFKAEILKIKTETEHRINKIKKQYAELSEKNNSEVKVAQKDYVEKFNIKKELLCDQLNELIDKVSDQKEELLKTAQYISNSTDKIGSATAALEKAYKEAGNPFPEKGLMNKLGFKADDPSWSTIQQQINEIRAEIKSVEDIANKLSKANINSRQLLKANTQKGSFFNIF
jgi:hypothetical protein